VGWGGEWQVRQECRLYRLHRLLLNSVPAVLSSEIRFGVALQKRRYSAKETYNLIDPTDRSHLEIRFGLWGGPTKETIFCKRDL